MNKENNKRRPGRPGGDKQSEGSDASRQPRRNRDGANQRGAEQASEFQERVVKVRRVTKVVKGGKNMSFSALVVIGDLKGNVGYGIGKAAEVVDAIRKAIETAKKNLVRIIFDQGSISHNVVGHAGSTYVNLFKAPKGTGLITCWSVKMALEVAGLHNVVCKTIGSTNPSNVLAALVDGIGKLRTKSQIRQLRATTPTFTMAPQAA